MFSKTKKAMKIFDPVYLMEQGEWEKVKQKIESTQNFDVNKTYRYGETILDTAVRLQLFPAVRYILNHLKGADLHKVDRRWIHAFFYQALKEKNWKVADFLLGFDQSLVNELDTLTKDTLLNYFIQDLPDIDVVKYLLKNNADVNIPNDEGKTSLCCAIKLWQRNALDVIRKLFETKTSNLTYDIEYYGETCEFVILLLEHGAIYKKEKYDLTEKQCELIDQVLFVINGASIK